MIVEVSGAAVAGAALTILTTYIKARFSNGNGNGNGNGHMKPCAQHDVMEQKFAEGGRRFEKIEERLDEHTETLTNIQVGIGKLDTKLDMLVKR